LEEIVVDVESCIKGLQNGKNENSRREVGATLNARINKLIGGFEEEKEAIALLKEKECCFLKTDKGNSVVVLDEGPYKKLERTPLPRKKR
jgi:hypothetical protein